MSEAEQASRPSEQTRLRTEYGPFLRLLDPETLAALTTTSVIQIMTKGGIEQPVKLVRLVTDIGRMVEQEFEALLKKQKEALKEEAIDEWGTRMVRRSSET